MAIFNEAFLDKFKKKKQKENNSKKASERKYGLLAREDIQNAISLIKQVIGSHKEVGKYLEVDSIDTIMKGYNKSSSDRANIATLYIMDPDDEDNQDVLIPPDDANWFKGDWQKRSDYISGLMDDLNDKLAKECEKKYGDSFEFTYSSSWYAYYYRIQSKKPKEDG